MIGKRLNVTEIHHLKNGPQNIPAFTSWKVIFEKKNSQKKNTVDHEFPNIPEYLAHVFFLVWPDQETGRKNGNSPTQVMYDVLGQILQNSHTFAEC